MSPLQATGRGRSRDLGPRIKHGPRTMHEEPRTSEALAFTTQRSEGIGARRPPGCWKHGADADED
jgi:hypothetical protein